MSMLSNTVWSSCGYSNVITHKWQRRFWRLSHIVFVKIGKNCSSNNRAVYQKHVAQPKLTHAKDNAALKRHKF